MASKSLDQPIILPRSKAVLRNRSVLAALTNKQSREDGTLTQDEIKWLERRAKDGFGIVTTAAAFVHPSGKSWIGELGVHSDDMLPGLENLSERIRLHGAASLVQIFHGGMRAPTDLTGEVPISSSVNKTEQSSTGYSRSMEEQEIEEAIQWFANAAERCSNAGFDGVEIHGAHGYLISQFLGTKTNRREDDWGGSTKNRFRFLIEIVRTIKKIVPSNFIIAVRISPTYPSCGITIEDSLDLSRDLIAEGIDILHLSCWDITKKTHDGPDAVPITAEFCRKIGGEIPILTTGGIWDEDDVSEAFSQGADMLGVGRAGIAHPDWPTRVYTDDNTRPPFTRKQLSEADLSPVFIDYMCRWDGFVED